MSEQLATSTEQTNGALAELPDFGVGRYVTDEAFDAISMAGSFLPRLQLFGGNSDAVKEQKIPIAHFGLVRSKDQIEDLGVGVDVIPLSVRFAAMRLEEGNVVSVYNPEHPEFKQIMEDSEQPNSRCMYGPQFLVYIPSIKTFATFLFGSKTSRREGRNMKPLLRKGATLRSKLVSNKMYKWHTPIVIQCSTPLEPPAIDYATEIVEKFNNPDETSVEFDPDKLAEGALPPAAAVGTGTGGERPR